MSERLYFLDNSRTALMILVVIHHVALTYGATSGWYYYEYSQDRIATGILNYYMAINRAYVLGFFFFISGYFTPGSLDRNGIWRFVREKALRLGVPLVIFTFLIRPSIVYIMQADTLMQKYTFWENIIAVKNAAPGPTWFLGAILLFTLCYILWYYLYGRSADRSETGKFPGLPTILVFGVFLGLATFAARVFYPTNTQVFYMRLGNFPQFIGLFIVGVAASRQNWPLVMSGLGGKRSLAAVFLLLTVLAWAMMSGGFFHGGARNFSGGWTWQSLFLSCWENIFCLAMIISILYLFHRVLNRQGRILKAMAGSAYGVFIIHAPIIVLLSYSLKGLIINLNPVFKFGIVSIIGVPLCFLVTHYLVRRIPGVSKIL